MFCLVPSHISGHIFKKSKTFYVYSLSFKGEQRFSIILVSLDSFLLFFLLFVIIVWTAGKYEDIKLRDYQDIVRLSQILPRSSPQHWTTLAWIVCITLQTLNPDLYFKVRHFVPCYKVMMGTCIWTCFLNQKK